MKKEFEEAGYSLGYEVLNTKNYGVPQSRERLIIFGVMNEKKELIQEFFKNLKKYEENESALWYQIKGKLYQKGFTSSVIEQAIAQFEMEKEEWI